MLGSDVSPWDDLAQGLSDLRVAAGNPSYGVLAQRVGRLRAGRGRAHARPGRSTVYDAFQPGRRRVDVQLVLDLVVALGGSPADVDLWAQRCDAALRASDGMAVTRVGLAAPDPAFRGRTAEVEAIVHGASHQQGTERVWALTGIGGVGKTQLALSAAARLLAEGHVDHTASVDLRGYDPTAVPASPAVALEAVLRAVGAPVPRRLEARREALDDALRRERWVIVLENVRSQEGLEVLVPHDTASVVLLTSRERLTVLAGVAHQSVDPLPVDDARAVLTTMVGALLDDLSPADVAELVDTTGRMPLALSLLAGRMLARTDWTAADHLAHQRERRVLLRLDDQLTDAVQSTYERLDPTAQRLLRRLAAQPCPTLDRAAVLALADDDPEVTSRALSTLRLYHVVEEIESPNGTRYGLHDVIRIFAIAAGHEADRPSERDAALDRVVDHHLARLWGVRPFLDEVLPDVHPPQGVSPTDMGRTEAIGWLQANMDNLLVLAASTPRDEVVAQVGELVVERLLQLGRFDDVLLLSDREIAAGDRRGDPVAAAKGRFRQGTVMVWQGNPQRAERLLHAARTALADVPSLEPGLLNALALASYYSGHLTASLAIFQEITGPGVLPHLRSSGLWNSGLLLNDLGRHDEADEVLAEALRLESIAADPASMVWAHANLAEALVARGEHDAALSHTDTALAFAEQDGVARLPALHATQIRSSALIGLQRYDEAAAALDQLMPEASAGGNRQMQRAALTLRARAALGLEDLDAAARYAARALDLAEDLGGPLGRADALLVLGDLAAARGERHVAARFWTEAEERYADSGAAVVAEVRERLARS